MSVFPYVNCCDIIETNMAILKDDLKLKTSCLSVPRKEVRLGFFFLVWKWKPGFQEH